MKRFFSKFNIVVFSLIVLAVVLAGAWYFSQTKKDISREPESEFLIIYNNSGFSPATINVPLGVLVVFKNNSTRNMWVASNPHPVHTDFLKFDNRRGVGPGQSYEFTFTSVGSWGYHDHLNPQYGGIVIVE